MRPVDFTVFVLTYGDHLALAERCLRSILVSKPPAERVKRIVLLSNAAANVDGLNALFRQYDPGPQVECLHYANQVNRLKYPIMRKAFYDPVHPVTTSHVMWFDDDSYLEPNGFVQPPSAWWNYVADKCQTAVGDPPALLGSKYSIPLKGEQASGIMAQPWADPERRHACGDPVKFCTGGWWVAEYAFLQKHDYPFLQLQHNGGDVMLGVLATHQRRRIEQLKNGVRINADADGRESKAIRRGESTEPLWYSFVPGLPVPMTHHDFTVIAYDPRHHKEESE